MMGFVEKKKKWNLSAFESVATAFDLESKESKGDKGVWVTAAMLMFLRASDDEKLAYIDIIKRAEARTFRGTVLEESRKIMTDEAAKAAATEKVVDRETDALVSDTKRLKGQDRKGKRA